MRAVPTMLVEMAVVVLVQIVQLTEEAVLDKNCGEFGPRLAYLIICLSGYLKAKKWLA